MITRRILVVDDEEQIREFYKRMFSLQGYDVLTAESGDEAYALMLDTTCWVLFLDLNMPGMNGIELCEKIRKRWPMAIIFAVTGYISLFELTDCRDVGFDDYFVKPVPLDDLFDAAENAFKKLNRWKKS